MKGSNIPEASFSFLPPQNSTRSNLQNTNHKLLFRKQIRSIVKHNQKKWDRPGTSRSELKQSRIKDSSWIHGERQRERERISEVLFFFSDEEGRYEGGEDVKKETYIDLISFYFGFEALRVVTAKDELSHSTWSVSDLSGPHQSCLCSASLLVVFLISFPPLIHLI